MTGTIYSGTYPTGISLSNASTQNPATISAGTTVSNTGTANGGHAIYGETGTAWSVVNYGNVTDFSTATAAVYLASGGSVTNGSTSIGSAQIIGAKTAITVNHAAGTVSNFGTVLSTATSIGAGVYLDNGGVVTNAAGGLILAAHNAVSALGKATISNAGTIQSAATTTNGLGIYLGAGGLVTNQSTGIVFAYGSGIEALHTAATVSNYGSITNSGKASAVALGAGGSVTNASAGYIASGKQAAITIKGGAGTLVNSGKIATGTSGSAVYFGSTGNITNTGTIVLSLAGAALQLEAGGSVVNNGGGTIYAPSGIALLVGSETVANGATASVTNSGVIYGLVGVGVAAPASSTAPAATIVNYGTIVGVNGVAVSLDDSASTLVIEPNSVLQGAVTGFAPGGTIEFAHQTGTAVTFAYGVLSLINAGSTVGTVALSGAFDSADFSVTSVAGGTDVTVSAYPLPNDVTGNGVSDVLMSNAGGALVLDEMSKGSLAYTQIGGLGPEWEFSGTGPLFGDGRDDFLIWAGDSTKPDYGALVVGQDVGGAAHYTQIGAIGPEWNFEGVGPLEGGANADFLLWDGTSSSASYGALVVGAVNDLQAQYTKIGSIGPEWQFEGVGNYTGNGTSNFLIWDTSQSSASFGALVLGQDVNGTAQYTAVGSLDPSAWVFEGSGNLLNDADGRDSFLLWNHTSGALVVGDVANGAAQFQQVGAVGPEWQFLGVGNYDGASNAEFLMRDSSTGALVVGTVAGGTATYVAVGGVGSEWTFHNTSSALNN